MGNQGGGPKLGNVILFLVVVSAIGFVIANAAGSKDGCEAKGGQTKLMWCVMPTPEPSVEVSK